MTNKQLSLFPEEKKDKHKFHSDKQKSDTVLRLKEILKKIEENINEQNKEYKKTASKDFDYQEIINKAKQQLKLNDVVKNVFKKYKIDLEELEYIPICFKPLEVSATTKSAIIYLNPGLLDDRDNLDQCVENITHYLCHEIVHYCQQSTNPTFMNDDNYLHDENEQEGFQAQTEFLSETQGQDKAEEYIDQVIDHHQIPKQDKKEIKDELLVVAQKYQIKQAGTFLPPDNLLKRIEKIFIKKWINNVYLYAKDILKYTDKNNINQIENLEKILSICNKFNPQENKIFLTYKTTLKITKNYFQHLNDDLFNRMQDFEIEILYQLNSTNKNEFEAYERNNVENNFIIIEITLPYECHEFDYFQSCLDWLTDAIKHETTHAWQDILQTALKLKEPLGLPKNKIRNKNMAYNGIDRKINQKNYSDEELDNMETIQHELRDVEFYTNLNDAIDEFIRKINKIPQHLRKKYLKFFVGLSNKEDIFHKNDEPYWLFVDLQTNDYNRWKEAIKQFYKAVEDKL